jgi:hypothetical protein
MTIRIAITTREIPGKGWIARAAEVRATASGDTESEALEALISLLNEYPDALDELRNETQRHVVIREVAVPV